MIMAQNEYEKIVKAMADKGVPHWAFELLADLLHNEIYNSQAIDGVEFKEIYLARDKFAHLDRVLRDCATSDDPIYRAASALWDAVCAVQCRLDVELAEDQRIIKKTNEKLKRMAKNE